MLCWVKTTETVDDEDELVEGWLFLDDDEDELVEGWLVLDDDEDEFVGDDLRFLEVADALFCNGNFWLDELCAAVIRQSIAAWIVSYERRARDDVVIFFRTDTAENSLIQSEACRNTTVTAS